MYEAAEGWEIMSQISYGKVGEMAAMHRMLSRKHARLWAAVIISVCLLGIANRVVAGSAKPCSPPHQPRTVPYSQRIQLDRAKKAFEQLEQNRRTVPPPAINDSNVLPAPKPEGPVKETAPETSH